MFYDNSFFFNYFIELDSFYNDMIFRISLGKVYKENVRFLYIMQYVSIYYAICFLTICNMVHRMIGQYTP